MLVFSGVKVTKNLVVLSAIISLCPVLYLVLYEGNLIKIIKCRIYQWNRKFENSRRALNFETLENILFKRCSWYPLHWRNTKVKLEEVEFRIINLFLKMDTPQLLQYSKGLSYVEFGWAIFDWKLFVEGKISQQLTVSCSYTVPIRFLN